MLVGRLKKREIYQSLIPDGAAQLMPDSFSCSALRSAQTRGTIPLFRIMPTCQHNDQFESLYVEGNGIRVSCAPI